LTCALATAYLAVGGMKTNGMGLLVDDDAIYNFEQAMLDSKPARLTEIDVKRTNQGRNMLGNRRR
jgi:hypothetical protein